jgi:hypothetical protein
MIDFSGYIFPAPCRPLERAAFFIAGQAVVALSRELGIRCAHLTKEGAGAWIDVEEPVLPRKTFLYGSDAFNARRIIRALLAGPAAETADSFGRCCASFDFSNSGNLAAPCVWRAISLAGQISDGRRAVLPGLWQEVQEFLFVDENWAAVTAVAESLIRDGELSGTEIAEIANTAISRSTRL